MSDEIGEQLQQCFELLTRIREEYPEGNFGPEKINGEMDFRYRKIKEDRDKLETFPKIVRDFARLVESMTSPEGDVKKFFQLVSVQSIIKFILTVDLPCIKIAHIRCLILTV